LKIRLHRTPWKREKKKCRIDSQHFILRCYEELKKIELRLSTELTIEELFPVARAAREFVPVIKLARQFIAPVPPLEQLIFDNDDEDQRTKMQKSVIMRIHEFENILDAIKLLLDKEPPPRFEILLEISSVISSSLGILSKLHF